MAEQTADILTDFQSQFQNFFQSLTTGKKIFLFSSLGGILIGLIAFVFYSQQVTWSPLVQGLSPEDAGKITATLDEQNIPYVLQPGGRGILVAAASVDKVRLQIASSGLQMGGVVGFEIFDENNFGATEFQQKVQYKRALEGELIRLITKIKIIDEAKISLAIPEKSLFLDEDRHPTASVIISIASGKRLSQRGVNTILNLVAGAIPDMAVDDVRVADDNGNLLSKGLTDPNSSDIRDKNYNYQLYVERQLEQKLVSQLEKIVGKGHVEAKVTLQLDFDSSEITEDLVDPDLTAILSEEITSEKSTGSRSIPIGVPGVTSNSPEVRAGASEIANISDINKKTKRTNFVNSKRRIVRKKAAGEIIRMSVAVLVDGLREYTRNEDGEVVGSKYLPWSDRDRLALERIAKNTVGYSETRGDRLTVSNFKFQQPLLEQEKLKLQQEEKRRKFYIDLVRYLSVGLGIVMLIVVVIRPMVAKLSAKPEDLDLLMGLPTTIGELEGEELEIPTEKETGIPPRDKIIEIAKQDPLKTASLVRTWLREKKGP
ncbi:MAG: flagellar M-ring protein FliF [SAR324 cluster bacterium]|uniref:Flagellar M-ring protein n=1 Tax=SAR324 cluster bacterium TaxID=2024889 RepID=A0A2A4SR64_9DELT|nr:MAG: flagellar M-ring protein FliF [SAR324 cluster bacterium]